MSKKEHLLRDCIGCLVEVKLKHGNDEIIRGVVYAYDTDINMLVLDVTGRAHSTSVRKHFKFINTRMIKKVDVRMKLKKNSLPFNDLKRPLPFVSEEDQNKSLEYGRSLRAKDLGPRGVSHKGQNLFRTLNKQLPKGGIKWENTSIVVFGGSGRSRIVIKKPYGLNCIVGGENRQVERVRKTILGMNRKSKKD